MAHPIEVRHVDGDEYRLTVRGHSLNVDQPVTVTLHLPAGVPEQSRAALLAAASHCTVHNTLEHPPVVRVEIERREAEAA